MKYQEFLQSIKEAVKLQVPEEYEVKLNSVIKNNDQKLDAITIMGENIRIAPNIYLNRYYEDFLNGRELESIVQEILTISNSNNSLEANLFLDLLDFDSISHQITYRLINLNMNKERLKDLPHQVIEDMAKIYYLVLKSDLVGISSVAITNDLLKKWKVNKECIDKIAYENTPFLFPETLKSMSEIMKDIIVNKSGELLSGLSPSGEEKELYEQLLEGLYNSPKNTEMYVLSNSSGINGASAMLYPGVLHNFAKEQNANIYILPSSIHELILIPAHSKLSRVALREMVIDVNNSQVPVDEILSNDIYYFDLETDEFHVAKGE